MARIIAVGKFDGVHLGHRVLLKEGKAWAREKGVRFTVFTFPLKNEALLPLSARVKLLEGYADEVLVSDLARLRGLSAREFLELLRRDYGLRGLIMGPGHRFGKGREGTPDYARAWGERAGVEVRVLRPFLCQGKPVSARHIRDHLRRGEVREARLLLGRYPVLLGGRTPGAGLGRALGYPTVNLELPPEQLRPRRGVYLAWAFWAGGGGPGLFYLGDRPTFPQLPPAAEVHLFEAPRPEPGGTVEVHLMEFLREDRRFPTEEALVEQIGRDVARGRELLGTLPAPEPLSR